MKENELVEAPIISPLPTGQVDPVLAHWTFGPGRSVAFTSDAGRRWTTAWRDWDNYTASWSQVIHWFVRPTGDRNLNLSVRREGGQIKIVVDALDKSDEFLNFLRIAGNVAKPGPTNQAVELAQTAPGRYETTVEGAEARGNYFVNLAALGTDKTRSMLSTGISVPYSDEYRELKSNPATLETIASLTDGQVLSWKYRHDGEPDVARTLDQADAFRRDPKLRPPEFSGPLATIAQAGRRPVSGRRRRAPGLT